MKLYKYCLIIISLFLLLTACDKDTEDISRVTYYPELELKGSTVLVMEAGNSFQEAGYVATLEGNDVSNDVVISGNLDVNKPGKYTVNYTITNVDGISKQLSRTVYVSDKTESALKSGIYTVTADSHRDASGAIVSYGREFSVVINQVEPGVFYTSDFLGGWYEYRAGYGPTYALTGTFKLNTDNTISIISSHLIGWGDSASGLENGKFDPATNTISVEVKYANMSFNQTLK